MEIAKKNNEKKKETITKESTNISYIIKGSIVSIVLSLILLTIYATVLANTDVSEDTITLVVTVTTGISILVGSSMSTKKIKSKGLINGCFVGLIYMLTIYLASSIISGTFALEQSSIIMMIVGILTGMIGGIIGVNIKF